MNKAHRTLAWQQILLRQRADDSHIVAHQSRLCRRYDCDSEVSREQHTAASQHDDSKERHEMLDVR
jgi:hypothetical protein